MKQIVTVNSAITVKEQEKNREKKKKKKKKILGQETMDPGAWSV